MVAYPFVAIVRTEVVVPSVAEVGIQVVRLAFLDDSLVHPCLAEEDIEVDHIIEEAFIVAIHTEAAAVASIRVIHTILP